MRFVLEIYQGDQLLVSGEMMYVYADSQIRKSVPVPDAWRERLGNMEKSSIDDV
jgi:acyl-CoA thioester hydrolase